MHTYNVFIRKCSAEILSELKNFGFIIHRSVSPCGKATYTRSYDGVYTTYNELSLDGIQKLSLINSYENEELFLAIAAHTPDNDAYQYFKYDEATDIVLKGEVVKCLGEKMSKSEPCHKMDLEELYEHFLGKKQWTKS